MTDPNVLKAIRLISDAVYHAIPDGDSPGASRVLNLLDAADALLAAAEKPAACAGCNGHGEVSALMQDGSRQTDACPFCVGAGRAEKPAEAAPLPSIQAAPVAPLPSIQAAPVAPLPWVIRHEDGKVIAAFDDEQFARDCADRCNLPPFYQVAAVPTVAAVKFTEAGHGRSSRGRAELRRDGWTATVRREDGYSPDHVTIQVTLRPGEDAGETVAKALAPVGRGP